MKLTAEQLNSIKEKAIAATEEVRLGFADVEATQDKLKARKAAAEELYQSGTKEGKIANAISKIPVCNDGKKSIVELVKVITGLTIELPERVVEPQISPIEKKFVPFSVMVPTQNKNSHDYTIGKPVMMVAIDTVDKDTAIKFYGQQGNHLQWIQSGLRPATIDEIDEMFEVWAKLMEVGMDIFPGLNMLGETITKEDGE